jgi:pyrroloquinoline-quinone synthase
MGELTRSDLREYARNYYHHVEEFPAYLAELAAKLPDGELRRALEANRADELGGHENGSRSHADLWLDFAEGMGASREGCTSEPVSEVCELVSLFHRIAQQGSPGEALGAFYAYESQVPRLAAEKARGLRAMYGADEDTCAYFTLHATADIFHANVWRHQLEKLLASDPSIAEKCLQAAETASRALWRALDGIARNCGLSGTTELLPQAARG